jgi:hypothetical protein
MKRVSIGIVVAFIIIAICVFMIEKHHSFIQAGIGFCIYIFPITFISSFKSPAKAFIIALISFGLAYIIYKYCYYDILFGVAASLIIGGTIFIYRIRPYKPFSPSQFKQILNKDA